MVHFERAIKLDPNFALAYSRLGYAYASLSYLGIDPPKETMPKVKEAIDQALKLDNQLAEAHSALAAYKAVYEWDHKGAEQEHLRAIELDPNSAEAHKNYAFYLAYMGRLKQAVLEARTAEELDPADRSNTFQYLRQKRI
jgi:Tfp pilus assembly protein PilF